jgi:chaperonin GroEL
VEYAKVKSVSKAVTTKGSSLDKTILNTMRTISSIVGGTLGPGGQPVLIERYEHNLPPIVTKDGVTVFRSLGFDDSAAHCIMEAARDAASRTASEAGDGTTTATILSEAIVRHLHQFCDQNPRVSPQRVVRHLESMFRDHVEPTVRALSRKVTLDSASDEKLLHAVAQVSANGDTDLADAVIECFKITGDDGNVTIVESQGPSRYDREKIDGFSVPIGYDESCGKFYPSFINDPGTQRTIMEKPVFLLYHGRITEIQSVKLLMEQVGHAWQNDGYNRNVVIVAIGYSETVLANLAANFQHEGTIGVFPLVVPQTIVANGQIEFLQDVAAVTGARILDPLSAPIDQATLADLGPGVEMFECGKFRASILGYADDTLLECRVTELEQQLAHAESEWDAVMTRERIAKLSGGIAKLHVFGPSNGERKEKRDRAEDAVCAVRGAIRHGCLPGGAWTLLKLMNVLPHDEITDRVLRPALFEPFRRLLSNSGVITDEESIEVAAPILAAIDAGQSLVYDFLNQKHVDPYDGGILDSTPAVLEAIRNSISIAALLGTLGGMVVFRRDGDLERSEARATAEWLRDANMSPADERP